MKATDEQGVALIMVLILLGILSVLGASLVLVSQTETWSSQNYRLMTEARYGAESGVHKAANYLMDATRYTPPDASAFGGTYVVTSSPVAYGGQSVVLSSTGSGSNYPSSSVVTDFTNAVHGSLPGGSDPVTYDAIATLVSMRSVVVYGSVGPVTVQTWRIIGRGTIAGNKPARVDVTAVIERQVFPMFNYAAFATYNGCGALSWSGGGSTDSYDSSALSGGNPVFTNSGGNVGTNGNLDENGGPTVIHGSLSTPRSGVGSCTTGAVTALTLSGSSPPTAGLVELPQPITYPPPTVPDPPPTGNVTVNGGSTTKAPGTYGDIRITGHGQLHLTTGVYNINSLDSSAGSVIVDSGPVILNVAGYKVAGDPSSGYSNSTPAVDLSGQSVAATLGYNPAMLQIQYAGSGIMSLTGGPDMAGLVYAPNATVHNNSNGAEWFGAVIAKTVTDAGHAVIHYDRHLSTTGMFVGPWMIDSFSWKKF